MAEPGHYGAPYTVDANLLPEWLANASSRFGVIEQDAWKVTALTSVVRGIQFNPGTGWSDGILTKYDETNVPGVMELPVTTESKYFMIVSRVNWQEPLTRSFVAIEGTPSRALPTTSLNYKREPGVIADFPVALVQVPANSLNIGEIVDLRVWRGDNGILMAHSELVMQYLDRPGTVVEVNGVQHRLGLNGAWAAINYVDDAAPRSFRSLYMRGTMNLPTGVYTTVWNMQDASWTPTYDTGIAMSGGVATIGRPGYYIMDGVAAFPGPEAGIRAVSFTVNGVWNRTLSSARAGDGFRSVGNHHEQILKAGDTVAFQVRQDSGKNMVLSADDDTTRWTIRRVGR